VTITNPAGTDISFRMSSRFYLNDGDASRAKAASAASARDREEEIPCGALRTIPDIDTVEGVIAFKKSFGFPSAGYGLNVNKWFDQGLRFFFEKGRVVRVETDGDQAQLEAEWSAQTGDKDKLGEFVLGCNPLLKPVPGSGFQPYYGFGDGVMRLTIGENIESGGKNRSSLHRWLMLIDGTVKAGNETIVKDGKITKAYAA
jgi:leucyl aminopeptidase (aminopeptidase T)